MSTMDPLRYGSGHRCSLVSCPTCSVAKVHSFNSHLHFVLMELVVATPVIHIHVPSADYSITFVDKLRAEGTYNQLLLAAQASTSLTLDFSSFSTRYSTASAMECRPFMLLIFSSCSITDSRIVITFQPFTGISAITVTWHFISFTVITVISYLFNEPQLL
jgi:hypothetical protein